MAALFETACFWFGHLLNQANQTLCLLRLCRLNDRFGCCWGKLDSSWFPTSVNSISHLAAAKKGFAVVRQTKANSTYPDHPVAPAFMATSLISLPLSSSW